jgi:hypothetical protein
VDAVSATPPTSCAEPVSTPRLESSLSGV